MRYSLFSKASRLHLLPTKQYIQHFSTTHHLKVIKPFCLADIGEGIRECEVIQWFISPGAHIEEFDKICEVQSDKASVDIPSRFSGVVKKLHYEAGEMAIVGKPLIDIDVEEEISQEEEAGAEEGVLAKPSPEKDTDTASNAPDGFMAPKKQEDGEKKKGTHASLATPAVRHLSKELNVDINTINGTGRDGRVTKEDIYNHQSTTSPPPTSSPSTPPAQPTTPPPTTVTSPPTDPIPLTGIPLQMYKTMTRSLSIPHFVYTDTLNLTSLSALRTRLNALPTTSTSPTPPHPRLSYLPFLIKALSATLTHHPLLNAKLLLPSPTSPPTTPPQIQYRAQHNIGIAMDSPQGLIVPVLPNVSTLSILEIASALHSLQSRAATNTLSPTDFTGATITLSNIGSIGGEQFSPVVTEGQVAILAVGRVRDEVGFVGKEGVEVERRKVMGFSWGADHRVLDGAGVARASECLRGYLEGVERLVLELR